MCDMKPSAERPVRAVTGLGWDGPVLYQGSVTGSKGCARRGWEVGCMVALGPLHAALHWAWYLQVQLHQASLPLGQGRLQDAVVFPQGRIRLSEACQLPALVLQFQSQLLVQLLQALDVPVKAPRFLKLKQIPERSWLAAPSVTRPRTPNAEACHSAGRPPGPSPRPS